MVVGTFEQWRERARTLLAAGVAPERASWESDRERGLDFGEEDLDRAAPPSAAPLALSISRDLLERLQACACHRDPGRWALMYRIVWRVANGERALATIAADPDVRALDERVKAVRRDCHKMTAFVRFREVDDAEGKRYVAWFEPDHLILRRVSRFFVDRFASMHWTIVTPDGAMSWDRETLRFEDDASAIALPDRDATESLWRAYYRSIFNPARLNVATMRREMPARYWRNLPEAVDIARLAAEAPGRATRFIATEPSAHRTSMPHELGGCAGGTVPVARPESLDALRRSLQACRRCPLHSSATQAVPGAGAADAVGDGKRIMLVGEQPGDEEDLRGEPFVGPAGRLLDRLLAEAGLDRASLYLTNAVKHFKWTPRGKRRIHKTPAQAEVAACVDWLESEIDLVRPAVIVAMGATALRALGAPAETIASLRGRALRHRSGAQLLATYHPSAILRADDGARAQALREALLADLRGAQAPDDGSHG